MYRAGNRTTELGRPASRMISNTIIRSDLDSGKWEGGHPSPVGITGGVDDRVVEGGLA